MADEDFSARLARMKATEEQSRASKAKAKQEAEAQESARRLAETQAREFMARNVGLWLSAASEEINKGLGRKAVEYRHASSEGNIRVVTISKVVTTKHRPEDRPRVSSLTVQATSAGRIAFKTDPIAGAMNTVEFSLNEMSEEKVKSRLYDFVEKHVIEK